MAFLYTVLTSLVAAALCTVAVRAVARRFGLVVAPREDRWHERPTALYGGVAIALGTVLPVLAFAGDALYEHPATMAVLGAAFGMFLVGVFDDARGIGPVGKFILQLAAGTLLIVAGVVYPVTPWSPVNIIVTLFWFVGIVNALNLLDNMDGVTAGVSAVAALAFAALFAAAGDPTLTALALAVAGAAAGFLIFNFKPASIFMGDSGSLFLGALLAGLGAAYPVATRGNGTAALLIPALILLVPILDTALVTVARTLNNRRISMGGRDHSTHRLVAMGLSEARAALFLYGVGAVAAFAAWSTRSMDRATGTWLGLVLFTGALVFAGYLGRMHRYEDAPDADQRRRGVLIRNILLKRRGLALLLDVVLFGVAYYGAFVIYYEGAVPPAMVITANTTVGLVIVLKLVSFHSFRVYRGVWDRAGLADVHRLIKATALSTLLVTTALFLVARGAAIPRSVFVLDVLLTGALALAARSSFHSLDRVRRRLRSAEGDPVLIYGAGPEADLALQLLDMRPEYRTLRPVAFLDENVDPGTLIQGLPVLGSANCLMDALTAWQSRHVIFTTPIPDPTIARDLLELCSQNGVEVFTLNLSLSTNGAVPHGTQTDMAADMPAAMRDPSGRLRKCAPDVPVNGRGRTVHGA